MNLRMNRMVRMILTIMLFVVPSISSVQAAERRAKERLAVLDLEATHGVEKSFAEALSVIVRDKLHSFGDYQVMSKGDIQAVASREQLLQAMGCDDDGSSQCLVNFGRAIGTRFMVAGDISKIGSTYTVSLRMLDTKGENAGVTNRVSEDCKCDDDALIGTVRDVAAKLVGKPTETAMKKLEEEKKIAEERKKTEEAEQKRVVEEKRKADELLKKSEAEAARHLVEEKRKTDEVEKQRLAIEIEKLKKENETMRVATNPRHAMPVVVTPGPTVGITPPAKTYTDPTTGMEFVYVPGGCFQMGDTFGDGGKEEKPEHEVCVDAFLIGKYEVTQGQYRAVTGNNPSSFNKGDNYPVEKVSWNDAQSFISLLNGKGGGKYRLPTEAEWEYGARSRGRSEKYSGGNDLNAVAWYDNNSATSTHPVGQKQPNGFGIFDMSGNVYEWCGDWYNSIYYRESPRNNPGGPSSGSNRVFRGGSWSDRPTYLRATFRCFSPPTNANQEIGFRLILPVHDREVDKSVSAENATTEQIKDQPDLAVIRSGEEKRKEEADRQRQILEWRKKLEQKGKL